MTATTTTIPSCQHGAAGGCDDCRAACGHDSGCCIECCPAESGSTGRGTGCCYCLPVPAAGWKLGEAARKGATA